MSRARARARLRRPTGLRRGSTAEQPREPAGSVARRPPSRRARTTVPSRAAHERCGGQYRGSRRYTHTSIRQKSALGVRRSCTLRVSPTSAAASGPPQSAPRVSSSSSSASPCSPKQPLRERAPTVCRPTSLDRLHECKPLREVLVSSDAQQGCGGRTAAAQPNLYACASAGPAGCAACTACFNTV